MRKERWMDVDVSVIIMSDKERCAWLHAHYFLTSQSGSGSEKNFLFLLQ